MSRLITIISMNKCNYRMWLITIFTSAASECKWQVFVRCQPPGGAQTPDMSVCYNSCNSTHQIFTDPDLWPLVFLFLSSIVKRPPTHQPLNHRVHCCWMMSVRKNPTFNHLVLIHQQHLLYISFEYTDTDVWSYFSNGQTDKRRRKPNVLGGGND